MSSEQIRQQRNERLEPRPRSYEGGARTTRAATTPSWNDSVKNELPDRCCDNNRFIVRNNNRFVGRNSNNNNSSNNNRDLAQFLRHTWHLIFYYPTTATEHELCLRILFKWPAAAAQAATPTTAAAAAAAAAATTTTAATTATTTAAATATLNSNSVSVCKN